MLNSLAMSSSVFIILFIFFFYSVAQDDTYIFHNEGKFSGFPAEYSADCRFIGPYDRLSFCSCTPNAHVFTIAVGNNTYGSPQVRLWAWDANPDHPVREGSTYTQGPNGIVITDVDGQVAWKRNIGTKRVAGAELHPNGNFVLTGSSGQVVWRSFDHPSDSLLVSQSLRVSGPKKIISRTSDKNPSPGVYSLVLEQDGLYLYSGRSKSIPILSYTTEGAPEVSFERVVFNSSPTTGEENSEEGCNTLPRWFPRQLEFPFELTLDFYLTNSTSVFQSKKLAAPSYNTTFSILRLASNKSLQIYTFKEPFGDDNNQGEWKVISLKSSLVNKHSDGNRNASIYNFPN